MSDDTRRILNLLAQGRITVDEADELLRAAREGAGPSAAGAGGPGSNDRPRPRFLRVEVRKARDAARWPADPTRGERQVAIKVPLAMVRAGMRLGAIIPGTGDRIQQAMREHGIDFDVTKLDSGELESMLRDMGELNIDVDNGRAQVRVTCESGFALTTCGRSIRRRRRSRRPADLARGTRR